MPATGWLIVPAVLALLLFMTAPCAHRRRMDNWRGTYFAHRGLHDIDRGVVENTLEAFDAAARAGYGMELDVQLTKDAELVVFHDDDLLRLCGDRHRVDHYTLGELRDMTLAGVPGARIPTLDEVLARVDGRTPLLIELKHGPRNRVLCDKVIARLRAYRGAFIVESFNPLIVWHFRRVAPEIVRGQLVSPMGDYIPAAGHVSAFVMSGLLSNCIGRPDFVAYDCNAPRLFGPHFQRRIHRTALAAWVVDTPDMLKLIASRGEICIFEKVRPGAAGEAASCRGM